MYTYTGNNPVNYVDPTGHRRIYSPTLESEIDLERDTSFIEMRKGRKEAKKYAKKHKKISDSAVKQLDENVEEMDHNPLNIKKFKNKVNHGQDWDYKVKEKYPYWLTDNGVPYEDYNSSFYLNGKKVTIEDYGNIHYGYVLRSMGYGKKTAFTGAGYANTGEPFCKDKENYGDNPNDIITIEYGIDLFDENYSSRLFYINVDVSTILYYMDKY